MGNPKRASEKIYQTFLTSLKREIHSVRGREGSVTDLYERGKVERFVCQTQF